MPHIVFNQRINLNDFKNEFSPIFQKEPILIKVQTIFVDKDNLTALLPSIVISDLHQEFLKMYRNDKQNQDPRQLNFE